MIYLYIFLAVVILLAYMHFEAGWIEVRHMKFAKSSKAFKILQLSDIHINLLRVSPQKVKNIIADEKPDLIILSGDYIEKARDVDAFLHFLTYIRCGFKVMLVLGNHDYKAFDRDAEGLKRFIDRIESCGVEVLHNRCTCIEKNSKRYNIIGIDDIREGSPAPVKALKDCCSDAFINIAFSHNPDIIFDLPKGKVDYLFSGHFHGGQIWAPFDMEFKLLRDDKLCKMGIKRGFHKLNGINLYINKGLGNVCFPLRFLSRPEITVYYFP